MRIDFSQDWVGSDGVVLVEGTTPLRMVAPGRAGRFSSRTSVTSGGVVRADNSDAPWKDFGPFPEYPGAVLTDSHLSIFETQVRNDEGDRDPVLRRWAQYTRGQVLEDISTTDTSAFTPDVHIGPDGVIALCSDLGITFLHYGTGEAYFFSPTDDEIHQAILDDVLAWGVVSSFPPSVSGDPTKVRSFRSNSSSLFISALSDGELLVFFSDDSDPTIRLATDPVLSPSLPAGAVLTDFAILSSGRLVICGTRPTGGFGTRVWYAVSDAPPDPSAASAGISWVVTTLDDQTVGDAPQIAVSPLDVPHIALNRTVLSIDDLDTGDATFRVGIIDIDADLGDRQILPPVGTLTHIDFDRGFPVLLMELDSVFGTGSLLFVLDGGMQHILWQRRYTSSVHALSTSPNLIPGSDPVYPGRTPDPISGVGADGVP